MKNTQNKTISRRRGSALQILSLLAGLTIASVTGNSQEPFAWQEPMAKVLPNGELEYTPKPYEFVAGSSVRYIDFDGGNDSNSGDSQNAAWKHHPWDADASGASKAAAEGRHTYVFKGGVTYRGTMVIPPGAAGTAEEPIRLTRDPSWGNGPASINGAEIVTGWKQGSHEKMPDGNRVWVAEVDFLPRTVWVTAANKAPVRLKLARHPNWQEPEKYDLMAEWPVWDQPEWWKDNNKITIKGHGEMHLGVDDDLPRPLSDLVGGTVWTEWGIVMGSPYPAKIVGASDERGGIAFRGPWTFKRSEKIITNNRYHLEDLPQFLDEPGEFWVEKTGDNSGKLFLRLPGDTNPNNARVEAGRHVRMFYGEKFDHIHWTGLTFRYTNVAWDYNDPRWAHPDIQAAAINLVGSGEGVVISHNAFEQLNIPVRISVGSPADTIGYVAVNDNHMRDTDHGAIYVENAASAEAGLGTLKHVEILRNRLERIGMRIVSGEHGHAISVTRPETSILAGNFLNRIAGWGLSVTGGKPSGDKHEGYEVPLSRHLVWHNRVEDVLLKSNDWGGIETWQGGSHYIFDNIVINALGFKNWTFGRKPETAGSFGHAYYMDGSFKNYMFNNIGLGRNNTLDTKGVNLTAIQNILSFENWYFNNSFHKFAETTRQQAPDAGRFRYLGNVFSDTSTMLFRHASPKDGAPDPNAAHYTQGGDFDYKTLAYSQNVISDIKRKFGTFEETGTVYDNLEDYAAALAKLKTQASDMGVYTDQKPLMDPDNMNWRPAAGSPATKQNVLVFVPWGVGRTVGEWQFTLNNADPAEVIDEHWFMTAEYADRHSYKDIRRFPLIGHNITAENYTESPLSNWTAAALALNGENQYLSIAHSTLPTDADVKSKTPETEAGESDGTRVTDTEFGKITAPAGVAPGSTFDVTVQLDKAYPGQQLDLHVHWLKNGGWGGFSGMGGKAQSVGENTYKFTGVKAGEHTGLASYNLIVFLSPDGSFDKKTANHSVNMLAGAAAEAKPLVSEPRSVNVDDTSFMVEAHLKTDDTAGIIARKMEGETGYQLALGDGKPVFSIATDGGTTASVTAETAINTGNWHHVLAEFDRENGELTIYIDGKAAGIEAISNAEGSLSNGGDFFVGGGPELDYLAGTLDFLRVSLSSLAESKTSIDELYTWQFSGPQYRDFAGNDRRETNAAGALAK